MNFFKSKTSCSLVVRNSASFLFSLCISILCPHKFMIMSYTLCWTSFIYHPINFFHKDTNINWKLKGLISRYLRGLIINNFSLGLSYLYKHSIDKQYEYITSSFALFVLFCFVLWEAAKLYSAWFCLCQKFI